MTAASPVEMRVRALEPDGKISPEELFTALTHLFKRRGYSPVPWASRGEDEGDGDAKKEEGLVKTAVAEIEQEMNDRKVSFPCQLLAARQADVGSSPADKWGRKIYWPRELLEKEFRAIVAAQKTNYPALAAKADWLLFGETQKKHKHNRDWHVFFKATEGRNPGILGMKWPRFDNRGPSLDSFCPVDSEGRPLHVVRKNKEAFTAAQWELALMNFRVQDAATREKIDPRAKHPEFIGALRKEWEKKGKVTEAALKKLAKPYAEFFQLIEDQKPLTPDMGAGRARYASPTLEIIREQIRAGQRVDPPQPVLRRSNETPHEAVNRYISDIKHPLVRHRLVLFRQMLEHFITKHGNPDMIVFEAVRSLALGTKKKAELNQRNERNRKERELARGELKGASQSISKKALLRFRLWKETDSTCPFCGTKISQGQLYNGEADIEHLVPRSRMDCSEFYNLTVGHLKCNRHDKGDRTPHEAFANKPIWPQLVDHAKSRFTGLKQDIFLSPNAEEFIVQKADLQHTAYIARVARQVALTQLDWLNEDGRDPTPEKQSNALRFQVTNGQLTSRLRQAWGLNQILHPLPTGKRWDDLTEDEQKSFSEKNRGDLRHHALDAMVIACTLPWLAHRTHGAKDEYGNHGWWTQDEKQRSKAANPVFRHEGQMHEVCAECIEKVVVRHHVSRSTHQQAYATTLYAKKAEDTYVAREVFTSLTPKNLGSIWPKEFASYCQAAWSRYEAESPDIADELKKSRGTLPASFTTKLCFTHYQKWHAKGAPVFNWPVQIKIPIRNVRLISVKDNGAVVPFSPGTHAFVKRTGFKEVQIHLAADGKRFVPVFIPFAKGDTPPLQEPIAADSKPIAVIRRGMVLETKKPFSTGQPAGKYRVLVTGQQQLKLLPHHVANKEEAILSFGLGKKGLQPVWSDLIRVLGYELPHPPSAEPESARPPQT